ncbi:MAG: ribosome assembly RNA-binding protein YhbY [Proteobacteria bacterium]|nr:ribosome assembly RNA-binding protein YhbY [Pseudomonadota bacterium]
MLTGKQRRNLRALGHKLQPIVQVGKGGVDDGLVDAVNQALADHELIKIKVGEGAPVERDEAADAIAARTKSDVAQVLGRTILLYRPDPTDPRIDPSKGVRTARKA